MRQWRADLLVSALVEEGGREEGREGRREEGRKEGREGRREEGRKGGREGGRWGLSYSFLFLDVDRSIRPLFPAGYSNETQVECKIPTVVSFSDHQWNGSWTEHLYITDVHDKTYLIRCMSAFLLASSGHL